MRILVTFAVNWEFKPWQRLRTFQPVPGNNRAFSAQVEGNDVSVLLTGIGPAHAARAISNSLDQIPDVCIVSGLAGALNHQHRPGEILVAGEVISETSGAICGGDGSLFDFAVECGAKPVNRFISTARVVRTVREKSHLNTYADAVDMESFAIMKEMRTLGVPCVAVRSVADSAEMNVTCDFDRALDALGRIRIAQVLGQVASDPRRAWPLARLGVRSSRAASSLARYLDGYTACLAAHKEKMDLSVQHIAR